MPPAQFVPLRQSGLAEVAEQGHQRQWSQTRRRMAREPTNDFEHDQAAFEPRDFVSGARVSSAASFSAFGQEMMIGGVR